MAVRSWLGPPPNQLQPTRQFTTDDGHYPTKKGPVGPFRLFGAMTGFTPCRPMRPLPCLSGSAPRPCVPAPRLQRSHSSEEHTSELQPLMRISYAVFCLQKKKTKIRQLAKNDCT